MANSLQGIKVYVCAASIYDTHNIRLQTTCPIRVTHSILSLWGLILADQVLFMALKLSRSFSLCSWESRLFVRHFSVTEEDIAGCSLFINMQAHSSAEQQQVQIH